MRPKFLIALMTLACAGNIFGADAVSDFSAANQLYGEGKFAEAAQAYGRILQSGVASANLWFDYGNAEFKAGHLGEAIAAFRQAELLAPRDSEIRANLGFARSQVQGPVLRESRWTDWLGQLTLNEWTMLAAIALWLAFLVLAATQLRPALVPRLRGAGGLLIFLTVLFSAATAWQAGRHFSQATAVVVADNAMARSGPFNDSQNAFAVRDGAELPVMDRHGDWVQVGDGSGRTGWLPDPQVKLLPGA